MSVDRQALARYLVESLPTMTAWGHRRVESVTFPDDRWATRRVSVDLTVPSVEGSPFGAAPTLVPLTFLRERLVLRNFDCRDGAGNALTVLTRAENAMVRRDMLVEAAWFTVVNDLLREQFLLLAWMDAVPGDRRLAKFCYDEELPFDGRRRRDFAALMGWRNETLEFPTRAAAFAQSFHFAANPPAEVMIDTTDLVEIVTPDQIGLPEPY